jgi:hypothetical protein
MRFILFNVSVLRCGWQLALVGFVTCLSEEGALGYLPSPWGGEVQTIYS